MMLTATQLAMMSDDELLRSAYVEQDSLTTTPLEIELLMRFERMVSHSQVIDLVQEYEITADQLKELCETDFTLPEVIPLAQQLKSAKIETSDTLEKALNVFSQSDALLDFLTRLISTIQEK